MVHVNYSATIWRYGLAAETVKERPGYSWQKSTRECERMAAETPKVRERLQQISTNQHERLAVENQPAWKVGSWNPPRREKDYSECLQYCPETDRARDHPTVYKWQPHQQVSLNFV